MLLLPSLALLLAGCTGDPVGCGAPCEGTDDTPAQDTGVPPYVYEEPVAEWTADEVGQQLFSVFGYGFPNVVAARDTYLAMMANGDGACPDSPVNITEAFILGCTAESDYYFSGVCMYDLMEVSDETGEMLAWGLGGDFLLAYPSGDVFAAGGGATYTGHRAMDGTETFEGTFRGTWYDDSQTNWLGQGFSGLFSVGGGRSGGKPYVTVHGGVGVGDVDLFFDEVSWDWGGTCEGKAVGSIRLRDTQGAWYVWTLDDDCDTCGEVVFHGDQPLGELCLDITPVGEDAFNAMAMP